MTRAPRASAERAARNGRADGTVLADDAGALLATADDRALTTTAPMPEILYFAPPASETQMTEVPVLTEGNSERDKLGVDEDEEQQVRGPHRDELWVTPDTRESAGRALPGRLAKQDRAPGNHALSARPRGVHRERAIQTSKSSSWPTARSNPRPSCVRAAPPSSTRRS